MSIKLFLHDIDTNVNYLPCELIIGCKLRTKCLGEKVQLCLACEMNKVFYLLWTKMVRGKAASKDVYLWSIYIKHALRTVFPEGIVWYTVVIIIIITQYNIHMFKHFYLFVIKTQVLTHLATISPDIVLGTYKILVDSL